MFAHGIFICSAIQVHLNQKKWPKMPRHFFFHLSCAVFRGNQKNILKKLICVNLSVFFSEKPGFGLHLVLTFCGENIPTNCVLWKQFQKPRPPTSHLQHFLCPIRLTPCGLNCPVCGNPAQFKQIISVYTIRKTHVSLKPCKIQRNLLNSKKVTPCKNYFELSLFQITPLRSVNALILQ